MDRDHGHSGDPSLSALCNNTRQMDGSARTHTSPFPSHYQSAEAADSVNVKPKRVGVRSKAGRHSGVEDHNNSGDNEGQITEGCMQQVSQPKHRYSTSTRTYQSRWTEDAKSPKGDPSIAVVILVCHQSSRLKVPAN